MTSERPEPRQECDRRIAALEREASRQRSLDRRLSGARLVLFATATVLAGRAAFDPGLGWGWAAVPALGFLATIVWHGRVVGRRRHAERSVAYVRHVIDRLEERWVGGGPAGSEHTDPDHPYASDLDLFGRGSVYERVCLARTPAGAATVARWLKERAEPEEIRARQAAIAELRDRTELRQDLAVVGDDLTSAADATGLVHWAETGAAPNGTVLAAVAAGFALVDVLAIAAWLSTSRGWIALLAAIFASGVFAFLLHRRTRRVLAGVEHRLEELRVLAPLLARIERERFASRRLMALTESLAISTEPPSAQIARLVRLVQTNESRRNLLFALISGPLLLGTQLGLAVDRWRLRSGRSVARWVEVVAEIEALASFAGYAWERPDDPFPEIVDDGPCFDGDGLAHPLLPRTSAVRNDVRLGGDLRLLLVSGSNMSGKSTLLRTVGVNATLAAAGAPVAARRLRVSPLALGASMRIVDSLQDGTSHFYAEIQRLARLTRLGKGPRPLLFLLDELFHGTNSHDRRVGAEALLRGLVRDGAIGLVTTHDLALARIADDLAPRAVNVHFADRIDGDRIVFDYRLREGVVDHSNALALMRAVGLDVG